MAVLNVDNMTPDVPSGRRHVEH